MQSRPCPAWPCCAGRGLLADNIHVPRLCAAVAAHRAGARDRFAHLPDKQRRTAAAELAMRFASMLTGESDDDGDLTTEDEEGTDLAAVAGYAPVLSNP